MPDLITLTCPTCGVKLKVTDQVHLLLCRNCGNEHMVVRDQSAIYLAPIAQDIRGARVSVDKTAAESAVARLTKEIAQLEAESRTVVHKRDEEWVGKPHLIKFLTLVGCIFFAIILLGGNGLIFGIAGLAVIDVALAMQITRANRAAELRNEAQSRINAELNSKREQLDKNQAVAES